MIVMDGLAITSTELAEQNFQFLPVAAGQLLGKTLRGLLWHVFLNRNRFTSAWTSMALSLLQSYGES